MRTWVYTSTLEARLSYKPSPQLLCNDDNIFDRKGMPCILSIKSGPFTYDSYLQLSTLQNSLARGGWTTHEVKKAKITSNLRPRNTIWKRHFCWPSNSIFPVSPKKSRRSYFFTAMGKGKKNDKEFSCLWKNAYEESRHKELL